MPSVHAYVFVRCHLDVAVLFFASASHTSAGELRMRLVLRLNAGAALVAVLSMRRRVGADGAVRDTVGCRENDADLALPRLLTLLMECAVPRL